MEVSLSVLLANASLLLTVGLLYDILAGRIKTTLLSQKFVSGLIIGIIGIALMSLPWSYQEGVRFDTRTILLTVSGLYFGLIPTIIACVMTIVYRVIIGGTGTFVGILMILSPASIGYIASLIFKNKKDLTNTVIKIVAVSLITHIVMLGLLFLLPEQLRIPVIKTLYLTIIIVFPALTILLSAIAENQKSRAHKEDQVKTQEKQYRSLFWNAPFAYESLTPNLEIISVNHSWLSALGYNENEVVGKSFLDYVHKDDQKKLLSELDNITDSTSAVSYKLRLLRKNGTYCYVLYSSRKIYDENNLFTHTHSTFKDETVEIQAELNKRIVERAYTKLFNEAPVGIFKTSSKGYVISVNAALVEMMHCESEKDLLDHFKNLSEHLYVKKQRRDEFLSEMKRVGEVRHFEFEAYTKTREKIWLSMNAKISFMEDNGEFKIEGFITEITAQKVALRELKAQEAMLRGLFDNMTSGMAIYKVLRDGSSGDDYVVEYFNEMSLKLEKKTLDEVMGKTLKELRPNIDEFGLIPIFKEVFKSGISKFYPAKVYNDDNYANWYENRVFKIPTGQIVALYDDVTTRAEALKELEHSEAHLKSIFTASPVGIGVVENRILKSVNPTFCKMLGYTNEELVGKNASILYPTYEDFEFVGNEKYEQIKQNGTGTVETHMIRKDGKVLDIILSSTPLVLNKIDGEITFTAMDITQRKDIERKIQSLNYELEQRVEDRTKELKLANQELEAFAYSVAHDLRTPLRAVNGFAQFLINDYSTNLDEEGIRLLNVIKSSSSQMDCLIKDLLSLTQIAREEVKFNQTNHKQIIESVLISNYSDENIDKYTILIDDLPETQCDAALFKHVWSNLISNAIKYSAPVDKPIIKIEGKDLVDRYEFCIEDNGVGFDERYKDKLFGVFKRLHKSSEFEGTGVGLAIVKNIVNKHYGDVWAHSKLGEGSRFYFSIPKEVK